MINELHFQEIETGRDLGTLQGEVNPEDTTDAKYLVHLYYGGSLEMKLFRDTIEECKEIMDERRLGGGLEWARIYKLQLIEEV